MPEPYDSLIALADELDQEARKAANGQAMGTEGRFASTALQDAANLARQRAQSVPGVPRTPGTVSPDGGEADGALRAAPGNPEFVPEWDVYRSKDGNPVTITWEQCRAIWHAVHVVEMVRRAEGHESLFHIRDHDRASHRNSQTEPEMAKSCLLGRMLVDGLPPTKTRPPVQYSAPAWHLLPGGDPFREQ